MSEALNVVGVFVGLVAAVFGVVKVWNEATTASGKSRIDALQAAADEWRSLKEDYQGRLKDVEEKTVQQDKEIEQLATEVGELRRNEGRLVGWIKRLHDGIEDGTFPPLPRQPQWLVNLMMDHGYHQRYDEDGGDP